MPDVYIVAVGMIPRCPDSAVDQAVRALSTDQADEFLKPFGREVLGLAPVVEPEKSRVVAVDEFLDLGQAFLLPVSLELLLRGLGHLGVAVDFRPRRIRPARVFPVLPV